jgi:hypothetical protein
VLSIEEIGARGLANHLKLYIYYLGVAVYNADFDPKKSDLGPENSYKWISFP